jgi:voltage-gated potassium channel
MFPAVRALRIARLVRIGVVGARVIDQSESVFKRSNIKYAMGVAGLIVLLAAVMVWSVEHNNPESAIRSMPDALWWAVTTVTTVGYGDKYPVSIEGKAVAITLMLLRIAIFGLISAALASLFVESESRDENKDVHEHLGRLEAKIDALSARLPAGEVERGPSEPGP